MLLFTDLITPPDPARTKVKFNMNPGNPTRPAWDLLVDDADEWMEMNEWRSRRGRNNTLGDATYLIALAQYYPYGSNFYIFGGMFSVSTVEPEIFEGRGYRLDRIPDYADYEKRLIIKLAEPIGRNVYNRRFLNLNDTLKPEVYELAPDTKLGAFPGYAAVSLTHADLVRIVTMSEPSWRQALSSVKAIYVVTNRDTGELYVGSASGNTQGLWQRWASYADVRNLTGGNAKLERLRRERGERYLMDHLQYSILEIFDTKTKVEDIVARESYWKRVLDTRRHGLNDN